MFGETKKASKAVQHRLQEKTLTDMLIGFWVQAQDKCSAELCRIWRGRLLVGLSFVLEDRQEPCVHSNFRPTCILEAFGLDKRGLQIWNVYSIRCACWPEACWHNWETNLREKLSISRMGEKNSLAFKVFHSFYSEIFALIGFVHAFGKTIFLTDYILCFEGGKRLLFRRTA